MFLRWQLYFVQANAEGSLPASVVQSVCRFCALHPDGHTEQQRQVGCLGMCPDKDGCHLRVAISDEERQKNDPQTAHPGRLGGVTHCDLHRQRGGVDGTLITSTVIKDLRLEVFPVPQGSSLSRVVLRSADGIG